MEKNTGGLNIRDIITWKTKQIPVKPIFSGVHFTLSFCTSAPSDSKKTSKGFDLDKDIKAIDKNLTDLGFGKLKIHLRIFEIQRTYLDVIRWWVMD